ncbi:MgtC/SapB family protein [Balneatrix alpica]|uniref:Protein MgtC n=1 Tax=Balneatrix alpica TaxID=75684 RepID=A0ABV5Z8C6_9GAMM|nr:MgtC/SapB family protein [Balneatrix alpica]
MSWLQILVDIAPLTWAGLGSAALAGGIIGLERQILGKPAGIRTSMLICVGTYVFIAVSLSLSTGATDPTRIVGQVITGIGFLGAGVMIARDGMIHGVTSAAVIWMLAAIGVAIGVQDHILGIKLAVLTVLGLVIIDVVEKRIPALQKGVHRNGYQARAEGGVPPAGMAERRKSHE